MMALGIFYYLMAFIGVVTFFTGVRKYKMQLISLTSIAYIVSIFVVILPGYYIATGAYFEQFEFSRGFDFEIYTIYLLFSLFFPISILAGRAIGKNYYLQVNFSHLSEHRMNKIFITAFIGLVLVALMSGIMNIPIINLLVNNNYQEAMQIKFDMRNNSSMLFFSKYLKFFIIVAMIFTFYYFIKKQLLPSKIKYKIFFYFSLLAVLFALSVQLGRDDIVQFMLILFLAPSLIGANKYLIFKLFFLSLLMIILWLIFSHYEQSPYDIIYNIFMRIVAQTGFSYLQLETLNENILGLNGIQMPLIGNILGQEFIQPSKEAYNLFYNRDNGYGTAGLAFAQMYFIFGFSGLIISSFLISIIASMDEILINSMHMAKSHDNSIENFSFITAFFLTFITLFYIQILTNFFSFFSFPFIFSFTFYIFIFIALVFLGFKVNLLRIK